MGSGVLVPAHSAFEVLRLGINECKDFGCPADSSYTAVNSLTIFTLTGAGYTVTISKPTEIGVEEEVAPDSL